MGQLISPNFGRAGRPRSSLPVFINAVRINDELWIADTIYRSILRAYDLCHIA